MIGQPSSIKVWAGECTSAGVHRPSSRHLSAKLGFLSGTADLREVALRAHRGT